MHRLPSCCEGLRFEQGVVAVDTTVRAPSPLSVFPSRGGRCARASLTVRIRSDGAKPVLGCAHQPDLSRLPQGVTWSRRIDLVQAAAGRKSLDMAGITIQLDKPWCGYHFRRGSIGICTGCRPQAQGRATGGASGRRSEADSIRTTLIIHHDSADDADSGTMTHADRPANAASSLRSTPSRAHMPPKAA